MINIQLAWCMLKWDLDTSTKFGEEKKYYFPLFEGVVLDYLFISHE